jgi:signal transduction histidine kinase
MNEQERLNELASYKVLDSEYEEDFDNLTSVAAAICGTSMSVIGLIDDKRQWYKSKFGIDANEVPRDLSFCNKLMINPKEILVINDATKDPEFSNSPFVTGEAKIVFYAGVPLVNENGLSLGTLCVIDKTTRVLNDVQVRALKSLAKQAMNLLELRRKKMELESAIDTIREKNKELERFAYTAAHDLRSPLNNIISIVNLLENNKNQALADQQKLISIIGRSSTRLRTLIEDLLNYSRLEKIKEEKTSVDIPSFFNDIKSLFYDGASNRSIDLKTDLLNIHVNKTALEQILINLISNAVKYNDKPLPQIDVEICETKTAYEFKVGDNGPGIDIKDQTRIFHLFETAAIKDRFGNKGSGIGLATVKKLVEMNRGNIHIESKPGRGATFIFSLGK